MKSRTRSTPARKSGRGRAARAASPSRSRRRNSDALALEPDCTLAEAEPLQRALTALLEQPRTVTLDAGAVQRIDTAALQLLAAFVRDRRLAGRTTEWRATDQTVEPAARLLGIDGMLGLAGEGR